MDPIIGGQNKKNMIFFRRSFDKWLKVCRMLYMDKNNRIKRIGHLVKFYDAKLSKVQKNAKRLVKDPVLGNVDHILNQLNDLKERHRRYIFAILSKKYGEFSARELAQNDEVRKVVDNFDDLDKRVLKVIDIAHKQMPKPSAVAKLKYSYYYKHTEASDIKKDVIAQLEDNMPDLLRFPKKRKKEAIA